MAARDIMPVRTPQGGTEKTETYHLQEGETFHEGEIVRLDDASGQLELAERDPDVSNHTSVGGADLWGAVGIAAEPAQGMAADAAGTTNPAWARRSVWIFTSTQEFETMNHGATEGAFDNDLDHTNVGDRVGLEIVAGVHGISLAGGGITNAQFRVTEVLDANKQPILDTTTHATWVRFRLNTCYYPAIPL